MRRYIPFVAVLLALFVLPGQVLAFTDIEGSWAREAINRLETAGVLEGIIEGTYQPNEPITREDAVEIAARAFGLSAEERQTLYTWLDHLLPLEAPETSGEPGSDFLTRAELIGLVANLLGFSEDTIDSQEWYPSFDDLNTDHAAFLYVEVINRLGILPTYILGHFEPNRLATRAEIAALVDAAMRLESVDGVVSEIQLPTSRVIVKTGMESLQSIPVKEGTYLFANGQRTSINDIKVGDHVHALYDRHGELSIVKVTSEENLASNLLERISGVAKNLEGVITAEQLAAILTGDWSTLNESVRYDLYQQLVSLGLAPWEAEAVLDQDWSSLQLMGQDRLASEASEYLKVTPELVYSLVNRDWPKFIEYAQVEIAQRLLSNLNF